MGLDFIHETFSFGDQRKRTLKSHVSLTEILSSMLVSEDKNLSAKWTLTDPFVNRPRTVR